MNIHKTYRYRVYPSDVQVAQLNTWEGSLRFLWNLAHEQRLAALARPKGFRRYYTAFDQINQLTDLRGELPWLADVPYNVCAEILRRLDKAWQRCFKKIARTPRWKIRGRNTLSLCEPQPKAWRLRGEYLSFPKLGSMRLVLHRPLVGTPNTCTLVRDVDQWFVCITTKQEVEDVLPSTKPAIGIDRGCINLFADSDGRIVINPRHLHCAEQQFTRAQRTLSRRKKGSKNRLRAKVRVAKIYRKIRRQRDHVLHCESKHYAESQGVVVLEALSIKNMVRVGGDLSRSIGSTGWGRFVQFLKYKCIITGASVFEVPAAYTSQTCSECGAVDKASRDGEKYKCTTCGHTAHADVNAARNILSRGTHGAAGCGGSAEVRRPAKQQLRVVRRGTRPQGLGSSKAPAFRPG